MRKIIGAFLFWCALSSVLKGQETAKEQAPPPPELPKPIILDEKPIEAGTSPTEMTLDSGANVRVSAGARAAIAKYEMSDARGRILQALQINEGGVEVECLPGKKCSVWVPSGEIRLDGGEHLFSIVKDGWQQACLKPTAMVEERKTGAAWQMGALQKARVERAQHCVLITHVKDSRDCIYVSIPAEWIVHTLKQEDSRREDERIFSGGRIGALPRVSALKAPMIIRLNPGDAVLIVPPDLPFVGPAQGTIEPPTGAFPGGVVSPFR